MMGIVHLLPMMASMRVRACQCETYMRVSDLVSLERFRAASRLLCMSGPSMSVFAEPIYSKLATALLGSLHPRRSHGDPAPRLSRDVDAVVEPHDAQS